MLSFTNVPPDAAQNIQTMRLRDDPPPITQQQRNPKKRKTPPQPDTQQQPQQQPQQQQQQQQQAAQQQQPQQPQQPQQLQHVLPPPHALMHPLPPGYPYAPADYTPGGLPPNVQHPGGMPLPQQQQQPPQQQQQHSSQSPPPTGSNQRALSSTKRAEQNRKAQRAFRERRDQHVKALESRSQLLDAALASADEANRRWEECRTLVDQLRVENAALRAALGQAQPQLLLANPANPQQQQQQQPNDESKPADSADKNDGTDKAADQNQSIA